MSAATCLFVSLNVPLCVIGMALFAIGTLLGLFDAVLKPMMKPNVESLPISDDVTTNVGEYLTGPSIACTVTGSIFMILAVMTCMTFCGPRKATSLCFVVVYDFFIFIFIVLTLTVLIVAVKAESILGSSISSYCHSVVKSTYISVDSSDPTNIMWNVVQMDWQCCGVSGGIDYETSSSFNNTWISMYDPVRGHKMTMKMPPTCCTSKYLEDAEKAYTAVSSSSSSPSNAFMANSQLMANCVFYDVDGSSNYDTGCLSVFWRIFNDHLWYVVGPAIVILIILLFLFVTPIVLIARNRKSQQQAIEKDNEEWPSDSQTASAESDETNLRGGHLY